jgi:transposase
VKHNHQDKSQKVLSPHKEQNSWQQMNRKQRREMTRKMHSEDLSLEVVHPRAAGIDIGNEAHYVAVPPDRDNKSVRRFGCTTAELKEMAAWLKQCGIRTVAMQSTGVYWIAVYDILEAAGLEVYLVNARETKNLPGHKSDVQESQWLMKLHTYGLLRNSFRPSQEIRTMRTYWRQRNDLIRSAARHIQRMQKALTQMNIQLANVLSEVSGVTGQAIIQAILAGERDPRKLAAFRDKRVKAREEEIARSLEGNWQEDLLFMLKQEQDGYEFCQKQMNECDERLQQYLRQREDRSNNRLSVAFKIAASTLRQSNTYLGAQFRRLKTRLGPPIAIKAMAAKLARLVYRMMRYGMRFVDRGAEFYEAQHRRRQINSLKRKAANFGLKIIDAPAA